jgi:DNA-binding response OmpR family regulator
MMHISNTFERLSCGRDLFANAFLSTPCFCARSVAILTISSSSIRRGDARQREYLFIAELPLGGSTPVLVICEVRNAEWVADALNAGADDFMIRPYEPIELLARINAIRRRSNRTLVGRTIELAGITLDRETNKFSYKSVPIEVTPREFTMAWLLFSTPGIYVSRETIGTAIRGLNSEIAGRTIEQHVYKLRKKLQMGTERGVTIRTAYNQGYRLELTSQEQAS